MKTKNSLQYQVTAFDPYTCERYVLETGSPTDMLELYRSLPPCVYPELELQEPKVSEVSDV